MPTARAFALRVEPCGLAGCAASIPIAGVRVMNALLELAEQCEKATGPDRDLDCLIAVRAGGFWTEAPRYEGDDLLYCREDDLGRTIKPGQGGDMLVPRYTTSVDAALKLVPEGSGWCVAHPIDAPGLAYCDPYITTKATTPALAMCAAALRARATFKQDRTDGR